MLGFRSLIYVRVYQRWLQYRNPQNRMRGDYEDSLSENEVWKGRMNGPRKVDAQEEEFQNVIEQTHIPEIEKCPSKGIIRRKEGVRILEAFLELSWMFST